MSDRRMTSRLNDIADEIATSRNLVEASWMDGGAILTGGGLSRLVPVACSRR